MLATEALEVRYGTRAALRSTTLVLEAGALVALVGPNGAGKSTLLRALAGLAPHGGSVAWRGTPLARLDARARARTVAYLPQDPPVHWPLLAGELVALGRLPQVKSKAPYDPRFSEDRIGIWVPCEGDKAKQVEQLMRGHGAEEVKVHG